MDEQYVSLLGTEEQQQELAADIATVVTGIADTVVSERLGELEAVIRKVVREEIAALLNTEESAVADCLKTMHEGIDKRLEQIEVSAGILVDGQKFLEKYLANITTPQGTTPDDEAWRESLSDDAPRDESE